VPGADVAGAGGARLRLFVALDLPGEARAALASFRGRADAAVWRPVADEALHVTLAFLGSRPEEDAARCAALLREVAAPAHPPLRLGGALLLPPRRPRVLCAAVEDLEGELGALHARVSGALAAAELYVPEARPLLPHVTVARLRAGARAPCEAPPGLGAPAPLAFAGAGVTLYRSRLSRSGARYEALARVG
jgi:2'-5' RNA ligase